MKRQEQIEKVLQHCRCLLIDKYQYVTYNSQKIKEKNAMIYLLSNKVNMNQQQQLIVEFDNGLFVLRS